MNNNAYSDDSEELDQGNDILNYKGVFYNEDTEQKFYEAGAHFSFKNLCKILEKLYYKLDIERRGPKLHEENLISSPDPARVMFDKQSRNPKQGINYNTQNLSLKVNPNSHNILLNNLIYNKQQIKGENGAAQEPQTNIIIILNNNQNEKSRNRNQDLNKNNDFIAKTNIYVKKEIDSKKLSCNQNKNTTNCVKPNKPLNQNPISTLSTNNFLKSTVNGNIMKKEIKNYTRPKFNSSNKTLNENRPSYIEKKEINLQKTPNPSTKFSTKESPMPKGIMSNQKVLDSRKILDNSYNHKKSVNLLNINSQKRNSSSVSNKGISEKYSHLSFSHKKSNEFKSFNNSKPKRVTNKNKQTSFDINIDNSNLISSKLNDNTLQSLAGLNLNKSRNLNLIGKTNSDITPTIKSISMINPGNNNKSINIGYKENNFDNNDSKIKEANSKPSQNAQKQDSSFLKISNDSKRQFDKKSVVVKENQNKVNNQNNNNFFFKKVEVKGKSNLVSKNMQKESENCNSRFSNFRDKKSKLIVSKDTFHGSKSILYPNSNLKK